ncbi:34450_t:CDS:2 [Gigaspora margarita]|uniref:34450_t:CDS:1 n=1 Tax=Gigaspora margarita TaxID=4874 RepID=A0ABN7W4D5_GIGMA|nr:34450_t:CDS:2 [Gigaspora margarita]
MLNKKRNAHLKKARQAKKLKYSKNELKEKPNFQKSSIATNNNDIELELISEQDFNKSSKTEFKLRQELHLKIDSISQDQLSRASYMLNNMIYTKGKYQGELISEYYQKKALKLLDNSLNKHESDIISSIQKIKDLENKNRKLQKELEELKKQIKSFKITISSKEKAKTQQISKIRSAIQKAKKVTPESFKKSAKKLFKSNNKEYSVQFLQMATEISNLGHTSLRSTVTCTKKFYEFITGEDPEKWINTNTLSRWNKEIATIQLNSNKPKLDNISNYKMKNLPPGYRAHEMPDTILTWIKYLKDAQENITELFEEELEEANSCLDFEEYQKFYKSLESGLKNAYQGFCKWMTPWTHLPLLVCALGGSNGSLFASAFLKVYTNIKLQESQSDIELNYIEILKAKLILAAPNQKTKPVTISQIKEIRKNLEDKKQSNYVDKNVEKENTGTQAANSFLNFLLNKNEY